MKYWHCGKCNIPNKKADSLFCKDCGFFDRSSGKVLSAEDSTGRQNPAPHSIFNFGAPRTFKGDMHLWTSDLPGDWASRMWQHMHDDATADPSALVDNVVVPLNRAKPQYRSDWRSKRAAEKHAAEHAASAGFEVPGQEVTIDTAAIAAVHDALMVPTTATTTGIPEISEGRARPNPWMLAHEYPWQSSPVVPAATSGHSVATTATPTVGAMASVPPIAMGNMLDFGEAYSHFEYGTVPAATGAMEMPSESVPAGAVRSRIKAIKETITDSRSSGPDAMIPAMVRVILEAYDVLSVQDHLKGRPHSMDSAELTAIYPTANSTLFLG